MPRNDFRPNMAPRTLDSLISEMSLTPEVAAREYPWADRFVMGLPLAPWQRDFKWSDEQCSKFITSAWTGVQLGSYLLTAADWVGSADGKGVTYVPMSNMIVDGQQRLSALERYFKNELAVPDASGKPTLWSELEVVEQRRFRSTIFTRGEIKVTDELELRRMYDLLNYGGTVHEENERALNADGTANVVAREARPPRPR